MASETPPQILEITNDHSRPLQVEDLTHLEENQQILYQRGSSVIKKPHKMIIRGCMQQTTMSTCKQHSSKKGLHGLVMNNKFSDHLQAGYLKTTKVNITMILAQRDTMVSPLSGSHQSNASPSLTQEPHEEGNIIRIITKHSQGGRKHDSSSSTPDHLKAISIDMDQFV
ncbi:hypothetical protein Tco_0914051 [Tanacetum coccineum]